MGGPWRRSGQAIVALICEAESVAGQFQHQVERPVCRGIVVVQVTVGASAVQFPGGLSQTRQELCDLLPF